MADAIPGAPEKQPQPQSTVVVQQPMTQWDALKQAGWWKTWDWIILCLIGVTWITGFYWLLFGDPGVSGLVALLLVTISLQLIWVITLIFRCSWFVLRLNADMATMPQEAARIAVAYLSGQSPPAPKK